MNLRKLNEWLKKLRSGEKLPKKNHLIILLLVGIFLFVITLPDPLTEKQDNSGSDTGDAQNANEELLRDYEDKLEKRTEEMLGQVEGVGKVSVMITLKSGNRKVVEKDESGSRQQISEEEESSITRTTEESTYEKNSIYTENQDGSTEPYVSTELLPEIEGVAVTADGGDNAVVRRNITEAVQALFGVEAHKIKIMKRADT